MFILKVEVEVDSSLSTAMAGNSLSLSGLNQGGNLDFDEDDTPRFMNLEEQVKQC